MLIKKHILFSIAFGQIFSAGEYQGFIQRCCPCRDHLIPLCAGFNLRRLNRTLGPNGRVDQAVEQGLVHLAEDVPHPFVTTLGWHNHDAGPGDRFRQEGGDGLFG